MAGTCSKTKTVSKVTWSPLIAAPCMEKFPDSLTIILAALMAVRSLQCVTPGAMIHLNLYFGKIERIDPSEAKTHTQGQTNSSMILLRPMELGLDGSRLLPPVPDLRTL